eukprot:symbB.v1.2.021866.t1/scaffold1883.1/size97200/5
MIRTATKSSFLDSFSNETVVLTRNVEFQSMTGTKPESFTSKIGDWVESWNKADSIRYMFSFLHDSDHYHLQQKLLEVYPIPEFLQKHSVSSRFMVLGSKTKGVALHQHFLSWLGLLAGAKRWFVFPPGQSGELEDIAHRHQSAADLAKIPGASSCVQNAGDVVILPGGWWHATFDRADWTFGLGAQQYNPNDDERHYAASIGNVSYLKKVKATNALLKQAAEYGHKEAVELLAVKAPMEDTLHTASHKGHVPVVEALLNHKADVNRLDDLGDRAINSAVMAGHSQVVNVLVQHKADVTWRPHKKKEPLLHSAARFGHVPVIKTLLESKAQLHQRLKGAGEAIHDAAHFGHRAAVEELVKQKADPFAATSRGSTTPLQLAVEAGHQPVIGFLQEMSVSRNWISNSLDSIQPGFEGIEGSQDSPARTEVCFFSSHGCVLMEIPLLTTGTDDEILRSVMEMSTQRVQLRGVSRRWMSVWKFFPSPRAISFHPPREGFAELELEVNQAMSKLILTCNLRLRGGGSSTVARMDWVPSYFGSRNGHVLHELNDEDADATWRLASRIFQGQDGQDGQAEAGQLRMRSSELVCCQVNALQVESLRCLIDYRRNKTLQSLPLEALENNVACISL